MILVFSQALVKKKLVKKKIFFKADSYNLQPQNLNSFM